MSRPIKNSFLKINTCLFWKHLFRIDLIDLRVTVWLWDAFDVVCFRHRSNTGTAGLLQESARLLTSRLKDDVVHLREEVEKCDRDVDSARKYHQHELKVGLVQFDSALLEQAACPWHNYVLEGCCLQATSARRCILCVRSIFATKKVKATILLLSCFLLQSFAYCIP